MASQDSSSPPQLPFPFQPSQQPPHHHQQQPSYHHQQQPSYHHHQPQPLHPQQQQQPPNLILTGLFQQPDVPTYADSFMPPPPQQPQPLFPFSSVVAAGGAGDVSSSLATDGPVAEPAKKKRGRPRKNPLGGAGADADGGSRISPSPLPASVTPLSSYAGVDVTKSVGGGGTSTSKKPEKRRGRPRGSFKKPTDGLGATGVNFKPDIIVVNAGEDIAERIMEFTIQNGAQTVCVMAAVGSISNVTLRQPASVTGTVTYEGNFDIISLTGSFLLSDINGGGHRAGGLSVSLATSDGSVLGGGVAGKVIAAAQVQLVVGSFILPAGKKPKCTPAMVSPGMSNVAAKHLADEGGAAAAGPNKLSLGGDEEMEGESPPSGGGGSAYSSDGNNSESNDYEGSDFNNFPN